MHLVSKSQQLLLALSLTIAACSPRPLTVTAQPEQQYIIAKTYTADSTLSAIIAPYKRGVDTQMQVVIGHTDIPLTKAQPESTLGNFVADATLDAARKLDSTVV